MRARRLLVIGLDSASPEYLFDRCLRSMPTLAKFIESGTRAVLRTSDPPISIPSWPVMLTGVDPGTLGLYGFRHRLNHSYTQTYGPTSQLPVPTVWDLFSQAGLRVCAIGMPPSYPPPKINGIAISDFLTPNEAKDWTYPAGLASELEAKYGRYKFDVTFRAEERQRLYWDIVRMTQQRFAIAEDLYQREPWDVFAIHEIGTDRLHHAYTKYFDPGHRGYVAGNPFEHVVEEYYSVLDESLARLLTLIDDRTTVVVASDHGSMPMTGCFCVNQWLQEKGYLALRTPPARGTSLDKADVDWSRTTLWGAGGYYARIFFNIKGREPNGAVEPADVPQLRRKLEADLGSITLPDGSPLGVEVLDPHAIYRSVHGDPPDLMVYFGGLRWRSAGSLGHPTLFLEENDTGPDDAVHSYEGVYLQFDPADRVGRVIADQKIIDVAPTLLELMGVPIPESVQGRPIHIGAMGHGPAVP